MLFQAVRQLLMQECKLSSPCPSSGIVNIDFRQFLALRQFVSVFFSSLRYFVVCPLTDLLVRVCFSDGKTRHV